MATTNNFYEYIELKYTDLSDQINQWLKAVYDRSALNLNSSSPYGQIINVLKELFQHNIIYLKNTIKVLDINQSQNKKVIMQTARIAGHNVGRAISSTGTLKFQLKTGTDIDTKIKGSTLIFDNELLMKNKTNSLNYITNLNTDKNIYPISTSNNSFFVPIIQGSYEDQNFTSNGRANQSISVNIPGNKQVENFNFEITYNGITLLVKDHLYDMLPAEYSCFVRSGFNGGIDIYFGDENHGFIPTQGTNITVRYLLSDGADGEILNPTFNDFKVEGEVRDGQGNTIDVNQLFDIEIASDINFASDGESIDFTKAAIPYTSRNFVLGTPSQFIYHIRKLNIFSKVNAYNKLEDNDFSVNETIIEDAIKKVNKNINNNANKNTQIADIDNLNKLYASYKNNQNDNEIYLYLIPSITKYFSDSINYFNIPFDVFYLDQNEQDKIMTYLRQMGTLSTTIEIKIIQPVISRYTMHVYIRRFDYANEDNIREEIIANSSDYLLNTTRFDRIPKADFIKMFKEIDGIDSASVYFVSKKNEDYHKKASDLGYAPQETIIPKYDSSKVARTSKIPQFKAKIQPILSQPTKIKNGVAITTQAYDPNLILGIDNVHGDIICDKDEYAIIRGGWRDRKGIWYDEDTTTETLNSINIVFDGVTTKK